FYGLLEGQFRLTFEQAERMRGVTGSNLLSLLERRLDNVVHRLRFAPPPAPARPPVRHRPLPGNRPKGNRPRVVGHAGARVAITAKSRANPLIAGAVETAKGRGIPAWLELNAAEFQGKVLANPAREDVALPVNEKLIVELYSK